ncbi:3-oxoacyl-[acyl-carrier protein] reductase [Arthrobacter oryzae]|uniref:SDR family NAD(P)-dependent oxidoreductase n=1 Tax=Arthrobacter TaxID=1663 RepID=UPI001F40F5C4|nr:MULTISPECIES: SDR family oxidoreductase [Arthrobacter]MDP9989219.1 3-oxoacyl-[acyl-carrier protein] reductase [Arthrobacter oryzae]UKA72898.1 SDR family oxidoreductase [Arthrobacter sp. FW306-06-A]
MNTGLLDGKVAIVTGGGRGLGHAMALGLAHAGASVVISAAREADEIRRVADEINVVLGTRRVLALQADVTQEADCRRLVDGTLAAFGGLHILVNNAGRGMKYVSATFLTEPTRFWEVDSETWRTIVDTNVNGPFLMAKAAVPHMLHQHWGRIINITMNHQTMRRAGFSPYGPSKAALESETVIWAQDLANSGVTVNGLLPGGATDTGMIPEGVSEAVRRQLLRPEVMVEPLLWLASDASAEITGTRLDAARWDSTLTPERAAAEALEHAGWAPQSPH